MPLVIDDILALKPGFRKTLAALLQETQGKVHEQTQLLASIEPVFSSNDLPLLSKVYLCLDIPENIRSEAMGEFLEKNFNAVEKETPEIDQYKQTDEEQLADIILLLAENYADFDTQEHADYLISLINTVVEGNHNDLARILVQTDLITSVNFIDTKLSDMMLTSPVRACGYISTRRELITQLWPEHMAKQETRVQSTLFLNSPQMGAGHTSLSTHVGEQDNVTNRRRVG